MYSRYIKTKSRSISRKEYKTRKGSSDKFSDLDTTKDSYKSELVKKKREKKRKERRGKKQKSRGNE